MAELLERWPGTVGEAIARNAWPARIARDGTVHVSTADSVWAFELGQRSKEIAERLGVPRLRLGPGPRPGPARAGPVVFVAPPPEAEVELVEVATRAVDVDIERRDVEDGRRRRQGHGGP
jgi:hypothetical protein